MVLRIIGRIIVVAFAFLLAALCRGFVLFTLGLERVTQASCTGRGPGRRHRFDRALD